MQNDNIPTRDAILRKYSRTAAADVVARATAPARHEARVVATIEAADALVREAGLEPTATLTATVLVLDHNGVGGHLGGGRHEATPRLLNGLGKGRWQARDGGAYEAALKDALWRLLLAATEAETPQTELSPSFSANLFLIAPENVAKLAAVLPFGFRAAIATRAILSLAEETAEQGWELDHETYRSRFVANLDGEREYPTLAGWAGVLATAQAELRASEAAREAEQAAQDAERVAGEDNPF